MELTWIAITSSLLMGAAAALLFVYAVKRDYFRDVEQTKYHVFWSDLEEPSGSSRELKDGQNPRT